MTSYRDVIAWQKAMLLAEATYALTRALPRVEHYGLCTQMQRAAVSIPSNIAEGYERRSRADYRRFIAIACGSLAELETQTELAARLHSLDPELVGAVVSHADEVGRILRAIERGLRMTSSTARVPIASALSPQPSALP